MDQHITLSDGRALSYREFGAPDGFPIINNHGGLVCGLDISPAHEIARELGIRIISPDRPGIGKSSAKSGRTLLDWASDVRELADTLKLGRFGIVGWSMGGQYALVARMPDDPSMNSMRWRVRIIWANASPQQPSLQDVSRWTTLPISPN